MSRWADASGEAIWGEADDSKARERYQALVDALDDGIYFLDDEGRVVAVNDVFVELTGYAREDLLGEPVAALFDADADAIEREVDRLSTESTERGALVELALRTAGGGPVSCDVRMSAVRSDGVLDGIVGVVRETASDREERERRLEQTERRFEAMFEDPNVLVGLLEPDGTVLDINETAMEYVDADLADVRGDLFWETPWWGESDVQSDVREWTERAAAGEYVEFRADLSRPDGERYVLEGYFRPVTNDAGEVVSIIVSDRDVTERVEHERRLAESEQRYRALAEHFPNGLVALFDRDLEYTLAAGQGFDRIPVRPADLEGKRFSEVWDEATADALEPLFEGALDGEERSVELEYAGRDWIVHGVPITDERGDVFAGMTMAQDITEQVEREAELERALDLLERTERIADVGGWEIDPNTEEVFWTEHLFDLLKVDDDEEPPLDEALDVYHEDDRSVVESGVQEALDSGDPFDVGVRFETPGGEVRWLRVQGVPETVRGEVVSLRGAAQDVTERKQREQRLEELIERLGESNERLEQFAYAASHDLQEPLRMVSSYLQLIEQRYAADLDADGQEFIEFAVDGADRMRDMIEGLLQYSRVDTRGDQFEPVGLEAVFADVREDLQVRIDETDAEITVDGLPRVEGDGGQLRQVFQNLLDNAIEYSGTEPPRVHVSAERAGDRWEISVSDEGIGIDSEDADRVFEVFQSLHSRDDHSGTGIGLALCERIVERHGGDIWVASEPGDGSTFTFTLPPVGTDSAPP
ncbi:PAS domain S-box protein [Halosimplex amylolyticum]|uniref:PAS domain S-box protein n=1 Tax=Halosimplex amylolyticum TaxID=3396616 RepID=UPI003F576611